MMDFYYEARRLAAAFGIVAPDIKPYLDDENVVYKYRIRGTDGRLNFLLFFHGYLTEIEIFEPNAKPEKDWAFLDGLIFQPGRTVISNRQHQYLHTEVIVRVAFKLGMDVEEFAAESAIVISATEKAQWIAEMPREFWPQSWSTLGAHNE